MIERINGSYLGFSKSSAYKDLVWTVATASDESLDLAVKVRELGADMMNIIPVIPGLVQKPLF